MTQINTNKKKVEEDPISRKVKYRLFGSNHTDLQKFVEELNEIENKKKNGRESRGQIGPFLFLSKK